MKKIALLSCVLLGAACAAHLPPTEQVANSMASIRGAQEAGAAQVPRSSLQLRLAEEELTEAKLLMKKGKNERANYEALKAYSDAELALALARQSVAQDKAARAAEQAARAGNQ